MFLSKFDDKLIGARGFSKGMHRNSKYKDHDITWISFINTLYNNNISLCLDVDGRSLHVRLKPEEAKRLRDRLNEVINNKESEGV